MADHQKIHPDPVTAAATDLEGQQKPTAPLVPRGSSRSDHGNPTEPYQRTIPLHYSKPPKKRRSCCCRFLCCTLWLLFTLIIVIGILAAIVYFGFDPKLPKYSVDGMTVTQFNINNVNSISAQFNINITARNPNSKIGISYEGGSKLTIFYMGTKLCEGAWPKFYQGHRNTTVLDVPLRGETRDATGLLSSLQAQTLTGTVPLILRAKVPVRIKLGKLKLPKWKPLVRCKVNVNTLSAGSLVSIKASSCSFKFKL